MDNYLSHTYFSYPQTSLLATRFIRSGELGLLGRLEAFLKEVEKEKEMENMEYSKKNKNIFYCKKHVESQYGGWFEGPGWYFWDETGASACGPSPTEEDALENLKTYKLQLDGELEPGSGHYAWETVDEKAEVESVFLCEEPVNKRWYKGPGWYFWSEVGGYAYGPHKTKSLAEKAQRVHDQHIYTSSGKNEWNTLEDSGEREEFETGSVRDTQEGKGRYDLLPFHAIHRLARHFENGAKKYGDNNWRKGQNFRRYISSALRHISKYMLGFREEDHLAAAMWNIACLIETEHLVKEGILPPELDDLGEIK